MAYHTPGAGGGGGASAGPSSHGFFQAAFANLSSSNSSVVGGQRGGSSGAGGQNQNQSQFDPFEWYPSYQNCQRYFLDTAQHQEPVQAVAAFINIALPCQRHPDPIMSYVSSSNRSSATHAPGPSWGSMASSRWPGSSSVPTTTTTNWVSLVPYIRRLVVTGIDLPNILNGFFGDDWLAGVGELHEQERRNYLFAAKSEGWASVKKGYDGPDPNQTVPFLKPLRQPLDVEIQGAEKTWSEWLAMEDWMVGPRAPEHHQDPSSWSAGHGHSHGHGKNRPR
ncbi:MAG: mediator complex subunit [Watsoniomyces obsoletus]|nr:MAG: mediator complex subunit [Watsoniomyces obsoletus]